MDLQTVAVKNDSIIIVGDVNRMMLTEHSPIDGSLLRTIPVKIAPYFMSIDSNNRVVVSDNQQEVDIIYDDGTSLLTIKPTINGQQVESCRGVCGNSSGIYLAVHNGSNTGHIHHYDAEGRFLSCIVQGLSWPKGIAIKVDDHQLAILVVVDYYSIKMYHIL